jgi:lytic murein transglycosylase
MPRLCRSVMLLAVAIALFAVAPAAADARFRAFLDSVRPEAAAAGVSRVTFDLATRDLEPDFSLPELILPGQQEKSPSAQAEFTQTPARYLSEQQFKPLIAQGRALAQKHGATLAAIEQRYGVPGSVLLAIWARETAYGAAQLRYNALTVLATRAFVGRRPDYFRREFVLALKMIQDGHITPSDMRSSWAGAMGQTQFMPSQYLEYAVDFDGDGKRDIWGSVQDALASVASQLVGKGWRKGERWGFEVKLPANVDCTLADPDNKMPLAEWKKRGLQPVRPAPEAAAIEASLLLPAGPYGPGFLVPKNYFVLKDFNFSDLYVLFVGHLADRIAGEGVFATPWGEVTQATSGDIERMQQRLTALKLYADKIDGKAGMKTRLAVGLFQKANGVRLDCWPSRAVLERMVQGQ